MENPIITAPDFSVKNLSEYSVSDLEILWIAVKAAKIEFNENPKEKDTCNVLDIWGYRIKDALKASKQNQQ